jgi:hypothetical protein
LIGITGAFLRLRGVLAVEVELELSFSADTVIVAAACARLMVSVADEPNGGVGDPSGPVAACFAEPEPWSFGLCRHNALISSIAASVV